jgi:hypothetical protein
MASKIIGGPEASPIIIHYRLSAESRLSYKDSPGPKETLKQGNASRKQRETCGVLLQHTLVFCSFAALATAQPRLQAEKRSRNKPGRKENKPRKNDKETCCVQFSPVSGRVAAPVPAQPFLASKTESLTQKETQPKPCWIQCSLLFICRVAAPVPAQPGLEAKDAPRAAAFCHAGRGVAQPVCSSKT